MMFKQKLLTFFRHSILMLSLGASSPVAAEAVAPDVIARNTTNEVLRIVKQDKDLRNGNGGKKVYDLVETKILPHFDFVHMSKMAMSRNWEKASQEQQNQIVNEFRSLLVRTYAASISSIVDYDIEFKPLRMGPAETDVLVSTVVSKPGAPPIPIDYRVEKINDAWKVYDVIVENVSLVLVYRNSFNSEVRRSGVDGLIASLSRRNQKATASK